MPPIDKATPPSTRNRHQFTFRLAVSRSEESSRLDTASRWGSVADIEAQAMVTRPSAETGDAVEAGGLEGFG
jgi:hypothetical protein